MDTTRILVEWWDAKGEHLFLRSDGVIFKAALVRYWERKTWLPSGEIPPGKTPAQFCRDICADPSLRVVRHIPQVNIFGGMEGA